MTDFRALHGTGRGPVLLLLDARHDSYAIDAHAAGFIQNVGNILEIEGRRGRNVEYAIGTAGQDLLEAVGEIVPGGRFGIDVESPVLVHADDDFARRWRRLSVVGGR